MPVHQEWQEVTENYKKSTKKNSKHNTPTHAPFWDNLLDGCCPLCDDIIELDSQNDRMVCLSCHFSINTTKFYEILENNAHKEFYDDSLLGGDNDE